MTRSYILVILANVCVLFVSVVFCLYLFVFFALCHFVIVLVFVYCFLFIVIFVLWKGGMAIANFYEFK